MAPSKKNKQPFSIQQPQIKKQPIIEQKSPANYKDHLTSWQLSKIDWEIENEGIPKADIRKKFLFAFSEDTPLALEIVEFDTELLDTLNKFNDRTFNGYGDFFDCLSLNYSKPIPSSIISRLSMCLKNHLLFETVLGFFKEYEKKTWLEIESEKASGGRTKHHDIEIGKLGKVAQRRLSQLELDDAEYLFSIRITKMFRMWGFRIFGHFQILWFDPEHKIYPIEN